MKVRANLSATPPMLRAFGFCVQIRRLNYPAASSAPAPATNYSAGCRPAANKDSVTPPPSPVLPERNERRPEQQAENDDPCESFFHAMFSLGDSLLILRLSKNRFFALTTYEELFVGALTRLKFLVHRVNAFVEASEIYLPAASQAHLHVVICP
jgi:hypothetical protein